MEFDKIGKNFNINNPASSKKEEANSHIQKKKENAAPAKENSPVNPLYWQSQKGVSFKGTSAARTFDPETIRQELMSGIYCFFDDGAQEKYQTLVQDWLEILPDTTLLQARNAGQNILPYIVVDRDDDFDKRREFLRNFLKDERYPSNEKIDYLDTFIYKRADTTKKFDEFVKDIPSEMESYLRFRKVFGDNNGEFVSNCVTDFGLSMDDINKLTSLVEKGKVSDKTFRAYCASLPLYMDGKEKAEFSSLISKLYEISENSDDNAAFSCFENLVSGGFCRTCLASGDISCIIAENPSFKSELIGYFMQESKDKQEGQLFGSVEELSRTLNVITPENFEDFKTIKKDCEKGSVSPIRNAIYLAQRCTNPKTGLFDKKIYDYALELQNKETQDGYSLGGRRALDAAVAAVDKKTGEISDIAVDFINKYCFKEEPSTKTGKFKQFVKNLSPNAKRKQRRAYYRNTCFYNIDDKINCLKDKDGSFNKTNYKYLSQIMESPIDSWMSDFDFFDSMKDENGVVDKHLFELGMKALKITSTFCGTENFLNAYNNFDKDKISIVWEAFENIFGDENLVIGNFAFCAEECFEKDGMAKEENLEFLMDLAENVDRLSIPMDLFTVAANSDNREMIKDFSKRKILTSYGLDEFVSAVRKYGDKEYNLDPFVKRKIIEAANKGAALEMFTEIFDSCVNDKKCYQNNFNDELFQKATDVYSANPQLYYSFGGKEKFFNFLNGKFSLQGLDFKTKTKLLEELKKVSFSLNIANINYDFIDKTITEIDNSLSLDNISLPIDKDTKFDFVASVLGNNGANEGELTEFENVIVKSIPLLKDLKDGLKISYPRQEFLSDLSKLCNSEEKIKILSDKTSITPILDSDGEITGYNGIMLLDDLDKNDYFENEIYKICHKFFYENEVKTGNKDLDEQLNKVIKACPEFLNTVGKPQHGTHEYSLDIHQLLVLAYSIENPDYLKLNDKDKAMLKLSSIFHDIAKQESVIDKGHQEPSSIYTRSIIKKFFNNPEARDRVYELIKNHHWLEEFSNNPSEEKAEEFAYKFRRPNDFDIAKIMAKSDLMAVSDSFYNVHKNALSPDKIKPIEDKLEYFYSTGSAVFSNCPYAGSKLENHKETFNGEEYRVINFHKIKDEEDLKEYGFTPGLKKKDAKFLVHMVEPVSIQRDLDIVKKLGSSVNGGVLSESLITPVHKKTYFNRKYGVLLSQINPNVINENETNQSSGIKKGLNEVLYLVFRDRSSARSSFKNKFLTNLNLNPDEISDKDYAKFYRECLASKTSFSQFVDNKTYYIGKHKFSGAEIKEAISKYQERLIDKNEIFHNEIVGYAPKIRGVIAKARNLSEVPNELLAFAKENDLPVVLI